LGALAAWRHNSRYDRGVMIVAVLSFSLPTFVVGYMLAWALGIEMKWLPVQGYVPFSQGIWSSIKTLILPTLALSSVYVALITRITRATLLETLSQDYIRTARSKGVGNQDILFRHALKNAAVPIVTVIGIGFGMLISGVVVTETVFNIPGLGRYLVDAIRWRDYPIVQNLVLFSAFASVPWK
jgi:peptide/nickel transport system permease protein